ncbi:MAG: asparagine synthase (glutamine-hydrolyzing), partial [Candidatus Sulfotelmatobacter sp.]
MCGIVGIVGWNARVPADILERATQSLAHRGPDYGGTVLLRDPKGSGGDHEIEIGLGNRRLAILDLSPLGHQPMHDPSTGNWIVYNGELYNFREVRARLEQAGQKFTSHSDTEVILKAYAHWGENCLNEFRGMFAFAIWDVQRRLLFVARDPMGIKPLYYYESERYFAFSSEVRTLLGTGLVPRIIDPAGLINFLTFGSVYDPNTLIDGVSALPPGHSLTWKEGTLTLSKYWDLIDPDQTDRSADGKIRAESEDQVAAMLDHCVRMQLVSDVPVGVFLSGGIDSSSLVGLMRRGNIRPSTFSIVFREA